MTLNPKKVDARPLAGNSWVVGGLPFGCQLCMKGLKAVYFMGGDCLSPAHCKWYCPISAHRRPRGAHFVNEVPIRDPSQVKNIVAALHQEIKTTQAQGMSFTGGDPLSTPEKVNLVCLLLREVKVEYGNDFHTHLYTSGQNFDPEMADRLDAAGLDSLRFHPDPADFHKIQYAIGHQYTVGAEVPVIPTPENQRYIVDLVRYLEAIGADYINLNEFEMCGPNQRELQLRGFTLAENTAATVEGSREFADQILELLPSYITIGIHFCSVQVKDQVQLRERYRRRAEAIQRPHEDISPDGCLVYLQIQGPLQEIQSLRTYLLERAEVPDRVMALNRTKGTLDLPPFLAEEEGFLDLIAEYRVKCGIYEVLPFREPELAEIREYTPLLDNMPKHGGPVATDGE